MNSIPIKDAALIHASTWKAIQYLPDIELQYQALCSLINFEIYDSEPKSESPYVQMIIEQALPNIISSRIKHDQAQKGGENSTGGGAPIKFDMDDIIRLRKKGYTQNLIASELGCHVSTVKRKINEWVQQQGQVQNYSKQVEKEVDIETDLDIEQEKEKYIDKKDDADIGNDLEKNIETYIDGEYDEELTRLLLKDGEQIPPEFIDYEEGNEWNFTFIA